MHLLRLLLLVSLFAPLSSRASLVWETRQVGLTAKPGDKELVALFPFKNTGSTPVIIRGIETSCECTTAELAKRTYAPGEAGTIKAVYTVGDRMGTQERTVTLTMDDPYAPIATLTLRVEIPERLSYSARMLHWAVGEVPTEKFIEVDALGNNQIAAIEVKAPDAKQFIARIETAEKGHKYRLFLQPARLDGPATIPVSFVARFANDGQNSFQVYMLVR
jgi:hypothetical protein